MISRALHLSRTASALRRHPALASSLARHPAGPAASILPGLPGRQSQRPFGDEAGDDSGKLKADDLVRKIAADRDISLKAAKDFLDSVVDIITEVRGGAVWLRFVFSRKPFFFFLTLVAPPPELT